MKSAKKQERSRDVFTLFLLLYLLLYLFFLLLFCFGWFLFEKRRKVSKLVNTKTQTSH